MYLLMNVGKVIDQIPKINRVHSQSSTPQETEGSSSNSEVKSNFESHKRLATQVQKLAVKVKHTRDHTNEVAAMNLNCVDTNGAILRQIDEQRTKMEEILDRLFTVERRLDKFLERINPEAVDQDLASGTETEAGTVNENIREDESPSPVKERLFDVNEQPKAKRQSLMLFTHSATHAQQDQNQKEERLGELSFGKNTLHWQQSLEENCQSKEMICDQEPPELGDDTKPHSLRKQTPKPPLGKQQHRRYTKKEEEWMVDSGSSYHITFDKRDFDPGTEEKCFVTLTIGNNHKVNVFAMGQCTRKTKEGKTVVLREVLLVPDCPARLIATGKMTKRGTSTFIQDLHSVKLLDKETGRTILQGRVNRQNTATIYLSRLPKSLTRARTTGRRKKFNTERTNSCKAHTGQEELPSPPRQWGYLSYMSYEVGNLDNEVKKDS